MAKSIFEKMGGTYHEENGYLIPDLTLPTEEEKPIGIWGQRHLRYIKEHKRLFYVNLLTSGGLNSYLLFKIFKSYKAYCKVDFLNIILEIDTPINACKFP